MCSSHHWLAGVAGAALLFGASQAGAVTYTITYQGTILTGYDTTGIFLTPGADLTGRSFTATLGVDTSLGVTTSNATESHTTATRPQSVFTSTAITIAGVTHSLDELAQPGWGGHNGEGRFDFQSGADPADPVCQAPAFACYSEIGHFYDATTHAFLYDPQQAIIGDTQSSVQLFVTVDTTFPTPPQPLFGPPHGVTPAQVLFSDGTFRTYDFDFLYSGQPDTPGTTTYSYDTYAQYHVDSVTIDGGVPEPAAWALMIAGFGAVGAALRRRRVPIAA
jgi:hypothetical protein